MLGETDARRDDLGSGEPSAVAAEAGEAVTAPRPAEAVPVEADLVEADPVEADPVEADQVETSEVPVPPVTGDEAVDEAMARLAEAQPGSFAERIDAGEHAHRSLQSRLGGLGGA